MSDDAAANLTRYVEAGGHLVCNFFSGIVDPDDAIRLGGYPGAFRELLGVRVEEFYPLLEHQTVTLADGATGRVWTELLTPPARRLSRPTSMGPLPGRLRSPVATSELASPTTSRHFSTPLDRATAPAESATDAVATRSSQNDVGAPIIDTGGDRGRRIETIRRRAEGASYLFVINHTDREVDVPAAGVELFSATPATGSVRVARAASPSCVKRAATAASSPSRLG